MDPTNPPKLAPQPPSLARQAWNLARALADFVADGCYKEGESGLHEVCGKNLWHVWKAVKGHLRACAKCSCDLEQVQAIRLWDGKEGVKLPCGKGEINVRRAPSTGPPGAVFEKASIPARVSGIPVQPPAADHLKRPARGTIGDAAVDVAGVDAALLPKQGHAAEVRIAFDQVIGNPHPCGPEAGIAELSEGAVGSIDYYRTLALK